MTSLLEINRDFCEFLRTNDAQAAKKQIVEHPELVTFKDDSGRVAVHWAASGGCLEMLEYCIGQNDAMVDITDEVGWTPLMIAASAGRAEAVKYLLSRAANSSARNSNGQTPLHYAASKNHSQIAKLLLSDSADVNAQDNYKASPLHRAASKGNIEVVRLIVDAPKLRIDLTDSEGNSALHLACEENRQDTAILLVHKGASLELLNKEEKTPVQLAVAELVPKLKRAATK
uniref:26S proteasome non-ATPase regulatory subunit 10 n=1 Tax=Plectus sambesii TaxID=2011161 RepID=A0A914W5J5_9BILA